MTTTLRATSRYTLNQLADALGVARSTLSTYRSHGTPMGNPFPPPDGYGPNGMYWLGGTIKDWQSRRPGHGGRPKR